MLSLARSPPGAATEAAAIWPRVVDALRRHLLPAEGAAAGGAARAGVKLTLVKAAQLLQRV